MRIKRSDLVIPADRQRKLISQRELDSLADTILLNTLLHPPVVQRNPDGITYTLVAGERRTKAIDILAGRNQSFSHNLDVFAPGELPITLLDEAFDLAKRNEIELSENVDRIELPWQDRIQALAYIHKLKKQSNPKQTYGDTATELVTEATAKSDGGASESPTTFSTVAGIRQEIRRAEIVAEHLSDPAIAKARNATEAFNLVIAKEEAAFKAALISGGMKKITTIEVRHGSLLEILPTLDTGLFDTICADPPYGIDANSAGFRARTVHHHNYDDSPDYTKQILQCILTEGFRVCKPRANILLFCDIDLFGWLKDTAARAGWDVFRTPITWLKSDSEGMAPWGREGFRRTTEWIFFARKGQKGLIHSPIDLLRHNRVSPADREYGPEKPVPLLKELLAASTLPGDYVLDPCCGSGSTLVAARALNMRALGIEQDQSAYNLALVNSQKTGMENL